jgi:hypothetical protein
MDLPAHKVLPFRFYFKVLGISTLTGALVWLSRNSLIDPESVVSGLTFSICTFLIIYGTAGTFFGVISSEDWKKFRKWISLDFLWK